jgi:cysteine desulfurase
MHANNELGTFNPVRRIAEVAHSVGALFHTDAVQTLGALPISFESTGADLISVSAHKIYGPKGVGVLAVRSGVRLQALHFGGGQERERRPGTENVAGIVGFGAAVEMLATWRDSEAKRQSALRDAFVAKLAGRIPGACLNGDPVDRLPGNANVRLPGIDSETLLLALDFHGVAASAGSACAAGSIEPSHVLLATGMGMAAARSSVRFSLGRSTTEAELDRVVDILAERAVTR